MELIHDRIKLTVNKHVAHVELARPAKMNALDFAMFEAIPLVCERIMADSTIRAVVLSGEGANFCSGLDKSNFNTLFEQRDSLLNPQKPKVVLAERTHGIFNFYQNVVWLWRQLPIPVIAAINGMALGGGLQISLGCDFRYASSDSKFSILEMKWGLVPDMGGTQIMRHLVRDDVIRELTYTADEFSAEQAKEWGFITKVVDDPVGFALKKAQQIASNNPEAVRAAKRIIEAANYKSLEEGLLMESVEQDNVLGKPNQIEAVLAQIQKRSAKFVD